MVKKPYEKKQGIVKKRIGTYAKEPNRTKKKEKYVHLN